MKKLIFLLVVFSLDLWAQPAVKLTRDLLTRDLLTRDPRPDPDYVTYAEWCAANPEMGTLEGGPTVYITPGQAPYAQKGLIALVVDVNLEGSLSTYLDRYTADLEADGFSVEMSTYSIAGSAEDLRSWLREKLAQGLEGAIFVGALPAA